MGWQLMLTAVSGKGSLGWLSVVSFKGGHPKVMRAQGSPDGLLGGAWDREEDQHSTMGGPITHARRQSTQEEFPLAASRVDLQSGCE